MAIKEPGEMGSMAGQVKTPMCSTNVGKQNTPSVKTYGGIVGGANGSGGASIMGPGIKATGGPTGKAGSNKPGSY